MTRFFLLVVEPMSRVVGAVTVVLERSMARSLLENIRFINKRIKLKDIKTGN